MKRAKVVIDESRKRGAIRVTTDALVVDVGEDLERGPAEAIADAIGDSIASGISTAAAPATVARRRRDGSTSKHLFYASGKLASGITATPAARGDGFEIVAPPDRLQRGGLIDRLARLTPVLDDPTKHPKVAAALEEADETINRAVRGRR